MPIVQSMVGSVRVVALGSTPLSNEELRAHITESIAWDSSVRCVVVDVQSGGSLSPRERVALAEAGLLAKPTAVLVESRLTRSILTAVSWLGGDMAAFKPDALTDACEHLGIEATQCIAIARALSAL